MDVLVALATTLSYAYSLMAMAIGLFWKDYVVVTFFGLEEFWGIFRREFITR